MTRPALLDGDVEWDPTPPDDGAAWYDPTAYTDEEDSQRWYDDEGRPLEYLDYSPAMTKVVSGPYGPEWKSKYPGRRFATFYQAKAWVEARYGRIRHEWHGGGRYVFRVDR